MGLGRVHTVTLDEAREAARAGRKLLQAGIDPLEAKRSEKAGPEAAAATKLAFREATERYVEQRDAGWSNAKRAREYLTSFQRYSWPIIGALGVAIINVPFVLAVLEQKVAALKGYPAGDLWIARPVTAFALPEAQSGENVVTIRGS